MIYDFLKLRYLLNTRRCNHYDLPGTGHEGRNKDVRTGVTYAAGACLRLTAKRTVQKARTTVRIRAKEVTWATTARVKMRAKRVR